MKKVYSIPTVEVVQLTTAAMISTSNSGEVTPGGPGGTKPAANESRGEWGDIWGK